MSAIDRVMQSSISLAGFAMDDMTRDEGWRFLILGRRIERLEGLAGLMSVPMQAPPEERERMFEWLLEAANSIVTYRARYRRMPELLPVLHLLVFDRANPHSVGFQVDVLQKYLTRSSRELGHPYPSLMIDPLARRLGNFDLTRFEADDCELALGTLATLLNEAIGTAFKLSDEVHRRYFTHTLRPMQLRRVA
jgi:uncharacterized alpha-E superfamily protein